MGPALHGIVRRVRDGEIRAWCQCPLAEGDPDIADHVAGETAWVDAWHDGLENLFVYDSGDGLLGKYDIPMASSHRLCLWAPSVREGPDAAAIMRALCEHLRAEGARRGVGNVEIVLEGWHDHLELAREALTAAGFPFREEKVVVRRDLNKTLPAAAAADYAFRPTTGLSRDLLVDLARDIGAEPDDFVSRGPSLEQHPVGVTMWRDDRPVGLVWPSSAPADEMVTLQHIGLVPDARGRGLGVPLLRHALATARDAGAQIYVGSTAVDNEPMRRTFARLGCEVLGHRFIHGLRARPTARV